MRKGRRERLRKGAIVYSSPQGSGYDKLELKHALLYKVINLDENVICTFIQLK